MGEPLTARETNLDDLFTARIPFIIPAYQREYSWTLAQTETLLDDLWGWAFDDTWPAGNRQIKGSQRPDTPYFLGSILLCHNADDDGEFVIDGHQRLMTLTILFAVLRDLENSKDRKANLRELIRRKSNVIMGHGGGWRFIPLERDRDWFERCIQRDEATRSIPGASDRAGLGDAQARMAENAAYLRRSLKRENARDRRCFAQRLLNDAFVAKISVTNADAAFSMFEVINQRGQPLSCKHVIKSRLMAGFERGSEREREANGFWSELEQAMPTLRRDERYGVDVLARFLDAFAKAHPAPGMRGKNRPRSLIERVDRVAHQLGVDHMMSAALPAAAQAYLAIAPLGARRPTGDEAIDRVCEYLSWWEDEEWAPAAMRILAAGQSAALTVKALYRLERFAAVMSLSGERKDRRLRDYQKIVIASAGEGFETLLQADGPLEPRADLLRVVSERVCDGLPVEKSKRRAILARVNAALALQACESTPGIDPGPTPSRAASIEHIMPRAVLNRGEDMALYPGWTRAQAKQAMESLGNLALIDTDDNAQAGRAAFAEKKAIYFRQGRTNMYPILEDLRLNNIEEWTPQTWAARHKRLTCLLLKAWNLPRPNGDLPLADVNAEVL